jgi:hypothetical protein
MHHTSSKSTWFCLNSTMSSRRITFPTCSMSHLEPDAHMPMDRSGLTQLSLLVVVFWGMACAPWSATSLCLWKMGEPPAGRLKGWVLVPIHCEPAQVWKVATKAQHSKEVGKTN